MLDGLQEESNLTWLDFFHKNRQFSICFLVSVQGLEILVFIFRIHIASIQFPNIVCIFRIHIASIPFPNIVFIFRIHIASIQFPNIVFIFRIHIASIQFPNIVFLFVIKKFLFVANFRDNKIILFFFQFSRFYRYWKLKFVHSKNWW